MTATVKLMGETLQITFDADARKIVGRVSVLTEKLLASPKAVLLDRIGRHFTLDWKQGRNVLYRMAASPEITLSFDEGRTAFFLVSGLLCWNELPAASLPDVRSTQEALALAAFFKVKGSDLPPWKTVWPRRPALAEVPVFYEFVRNPAGPPLPLPALLVLHKALNRSGCRHPEVAFLRIRLAETAAVWTVSTLIYLTRQRKSPAHHSNRGGSRAA